MKGLLFSFLALGASLFANEKIVVRVGHFPNITHAQGIIGQHFSRIKKGWFEDALGPNVEVQWFVYTDGPAAIEGLYTQAIDMTYVGPSPTINIFAKSKKKNICIICGGCCSGAALVVQSGEKFTTPADFKGKKISTPQIGNTQDIAARTWLINNGFHQTMTVGDALVIPTTQTNQFQLFKTKQLDAIWTIEPWVSHLVLKGGARIYLQESSLWTETQGKYVTAHLVSSVNFLEKYPEIAKKWVAAHVKLTDWIVKNPSQAKKIVQQELKEETKFEMDDTLLDMAWNNIELTSDPIAASLEKYALDAYKLKFFKIKPDLTGIYELKFLEEALKRPLEENNNAKKVK